MSLTIESLLEENRLREDQISKGISDHDLIELANCFDGVEDYIDHEQFGLNTGQKEDVRNKSLQGNSRAVKRLLRLWKQSNPYKATFKALLNILLDMKKGDVAIDVCKCVKKRSSNHESSNHERRKTYCDRHYLLPGSIMMMLIIALFACLIGYNYFQETSPHPVIPQGPTLKMTNFEQHRKDDDMWYSPPNYTHHQGYNICLGVVANGEQTGYGTHVTVGVYFMRGEFDDSLKWPFRGVISFQLVDQLDGVDHKEHNVSYDDSVEDKHCSRVIRGERSEWGLGPDRFIAHNRLKPKYLRNDCLQFRIHRVDLVQNKISVNSVKPTRVFSDKKPKMSELRSFNTHGHIIDLVTEIGVDYIKFGTLILLDDHGKQVKAIQLSCQYQLECIVNKILVDWLNGKGALPVTWDTLTLMLEKSDLKVLASDIMQNTD